MKEEQLSQVNQALLQELSKLSKKPITLEFADSASGIVRHDQGQLLAGDHLTLQINDLTNPDYTVSHEVIHALLQLKQEIPAISFNLTTGKPELDRKLMATAVELYDIVVHFLVYQKQAELNLLNDTVKEQYFKGLLATLQPEPTTGLDNWMVLRMVLILDALVFFQAEQANILLKLQELYPIATQKAQLLFAVISAKPVIDAFTVGRAVARLFRTFDKCLADLNLVEMHLNDFVTFQLVLSERQQRWAVHQLFDIFRTDLKESATMKNAYVGRYKNNEQDSFVLTAPAKNSDTYFKEIYDLPVGEFLKQINTPCLTR